MNSYYTLFIIRLYNDSSLTNVRINKNPWQWRWRYTNEPRSILPGRIPSDSNDPGQIRIGSCRNPFSQIPTAGSNRIRTKSDRILADYVGFYRLTTKSGSESDWKDCLIWEYGKIVQEKGDMTSLFHAYSSSVTHISCIPSK
jgi:hypothetical protein